MRSPTYSSHFSKREDGESSVTIFSYGKLPSSAMYPRIDRVSFYQMDSTRQGDRSANRLSSNSLLSKFRSNKELVRGSRQRKESLYNVFVRLTPTPRIADIWWSCQLIKTAEDVSAKRFISSLHEVTLVLPGCLQVYTYATSFYSLM